ncbi:hypothetical protein [Stutzerimonas nitrititolerans]|uniref:hypothetical protein n=1 Tax=Stutzerimonas nitrititolerans TaxID=2482751 RepID=UPI0028A011D7|nr:hypothetical protein [Stutzerimonas nitrititolerans]
MAEKIRVSWLLAVVLLIPIAALLAGQIAFLTPHLTYLSMLLIATAAAIGAFRRHGQLKQVQPFWCIFIGLSASLLSLLL